MNNEEGIKDAFRYMSQYDENAKTILADKEILANILVHTVDEFIGMNPGDVTGLIEGEPSIGNTPVAPGLTNEKEGGTNGKTVASLITGMNTESKVRNEGVTYFDILFYVRTKDGLSKVIVNLEAQKGEPYGYDVEMRGIYYASREVSSQLHREFASQHYNEIKKVYSIWIVMNAKEDTMDKIHLHKKDILGVSRWKSMYDVLNVIIIRIRNALPEDNTQKLHRLLGALFAENAAFEKRCEVLVQRILSNWQFDLPIFLMALLPKPRRSHRYACVCGVDPQKNILRQTIQNLISVVLKEFGIGLEEDQKGMVNHMCNLGEGIWERGIAEGVERGITEGMERGIVVGLERGKKQGIECEKMDVAVRMIEDGAVSLEKIALYSGLPLERVLELKKELQFQMA